MNEPGALHQRTIVAAFPVSFGMVATASWLKTLAAKATVTTHPPTMWDLPPFAPESTTVFGKVPAHARTLIRSTQFALCAL